MDNIEAGKILLDIKKQVKKNSEMLKDLRAKNRRDALVKLIKYLILIASALYTWHYIQPFYESIMGASAQINSMGEETSNLFSKLNQFSGMLDKIPLVGKN